MAGFKPGDKVIVKVGGKKYETCITDDNVQRFKENRIVSALLDSSDLDLNKIAIMYQRGMFSQREFAEFNMMLGYSICGFSDLSFFEDMEIENPIGGTSEEA